MKDIPNYCTLYFANDSFKEAATAAIRLAVYKSRHTYMRGWKNKTTKATRVIASLYLGTKLSSRDFAYLYHCCKLYSIDLMRYPMGPDRQLTQSQKDTLYGMERVQEEMRKLSSSMSELDRTFAKYGLNARAMFVDEFKPFKGVIANVERS